MVSDRCGRVTELMHLSAGLVIDWELMQDGDATTVKGMTNVPATMPNAGKKINLYGSQTQAVNQVFRARFAAARILWPGMPSIRIGGARKRAKRKSGEWGKVARDRFHQKFPSHRRALNRCKMSGCRLYIPNYFQERVIKREVSRRGPSVGPASH